MIYEIEAELAEHVLVVAEPMWNFDKHLTEEYLKSASYKNNYKQIAVFDDRDVIFFENSTPDSGAFYGYLFRLHLIPLKTFKKDIFHNDTRIGKIIVVWRDTSIYFNFYASIVSILLIVIVHLYSKIAIAKSSLEEKVSVIKQQVIELRNQKSFTENIFNVVPEGLITIDGNRELVRNNHSFDMLVEDWAKILGKEEEAVKKLILISINEQLQKNPQGQYSMLIDGYTFTIDYSSSSLSSNAAKLVISLRDITKITEIEREMNQSRKLEAVGRLASGIAHEINTPTQYVVANIDFLSDAFTDLGKAFSDIGQLRKAENGKVTEERLTAICDTLMGADWEFLEEEIPKALEQSREGLRRISSIVSAMKNFSHPSGNTSELANINSAIENTVTVARNEWKYSSKVTLNLAPHLPLIPCYLDELNQVFLGMIVNSAHAIIQKYGEDADTKGTIIISTNVEDRRAVIVISDDGIGMPKGIQEKIFDPFFTTKELNKGTGQGLAIARDVIVNKHKGTIAVNSEEGVGTTFTITLPFPGA